MRPGISRDPVNRGTVCWGFTVPCFKGYRTVRLRTVRLRTLLLKMSGLKRFRGFGGKVHVKRNQMLFILINKASKIELTFDSVIGEVGM